MIQLLAIAMTLSGAMLLVPAFLSTWKLAHGLPDGFSRRCWFLLGCLIGCFFLGYLLFAHLQWGHCHDWRDLVVPVIFLLGAGFCWLVTRVSLHTMQDLRGRFQHEIELVVERDRALSENRAKSAFLATMSHEIRTPLNGVIGMTGLLLDSGLNEEQLGYARTVKHSGEALLGVLNDILDFSKLEADKIELEVIDFDLRVCLEDCLEMMAFRAQEKGLELALLFRPEVPEFVRGDPGRLRQVVLNLLGNAIKFTAQGEVVVEVTRPQAALLVSVRDSGTGIAPEVQSLLFQPFQQASSSTARVFGGTGLGLAICRRLVEVMGGQIGLESEVGRGSTFWFTLPVALGSPPQPSTPRKELNGLRVLVVEDQLTNCQVMELQLARWGCQVTCLRHPSEVLPHLARHPYDVALVDHTLPEVSGEELALRIKADPAASALPLVLLTSLPQRGQGQRAQRAGFAGYLTKPVRLQVLLDTLATVTGASAPGPLVTRHTLEEHRARVRRRVLIADDNAVNQRVLSRILEKAGYNCDVVGNGLEVLSALENLPYDVVLMDCQMPEMDGYEASRLVRSSEKPYRHIPIVAVSAGVTLEERRRCQESGMTGFLAKPLQPQELLRSLHELMDS